MKGAKCKCGFATVAEKRKCPKCGRGMSPAEWPDEGEVQSFAALQVIPERLKEPYNMALVSLDKGPKIICWVSKTLKVGDPVAISEHDGVFFCSKKEDLKFRIDKGSLKS